MNLLQQAIVRTRKTGFQLFYLAYATLTDDEEVTDEYIQTAYRYYEQGIGLSPFMENFLSDVLAGNREI